MNGAHDDTCLDHGPVFARAMRDSLWAKPAFGADGQAFSCTRAVKDGVRDETCDTLAVLLP